jgi:two-component system, LytTR family, response regulator
MSTIIKVILIDDEPLAIALLQEYLQTISNIDIIATCADGFEGVKAIAKHQPDLIFLDVQMPKLNGFEMLELLDEVPAVIFTTAFDAYAIKAFDAKAIDYLLKPYTQDRLLEAINKLKPSTNNSHQLFEKATTDAPLIPTFQAPRIVIKDNHQIFIIPYSDIIHIDAADDYVKIHTATRHYLKKKTLTYFDNTLPSNEFCKVHRSHIIAINQIAKVEPYEKDGAIITLLNKKEIPVSKSGYMKLKERLGI